MDSIIHMFPQMVSAGAILLSALKHTSIGIVAYTRKGRIVYANDRFYEQYACDTRPAFIVDVIGEALWDIWYSETKVVLSSNSPLRYIAQLGRREDGMWISSRTSSWGDPVDHQHTVYAEVLPASLRRGLVVRARILLTDVLRYVPPEFELERDTTITARALVQDE